MYCFIELINRKYNQGLENNVNHGEIYFGNCLKMNWVQVRKQSLRLD